MRDGWVETTLVDVAELVMGQSPPGDTYNRDGVGFPFIQGSAEFGTRSPVPVQWCSAPKKLARVGDLLVSVRAPVGDLNVADQPIAIGRGLAVVRATSASTTPFLGLAIQQGLPALRRRSTGGMFDSITKEGLSGLPLLLPPLEVQRRIVDLVESVDAYIAALQRQAKDLSASRTLLLNDLINAGADVEVFPLGRICEIVSSLVDPTLQIHSNLPHIGIERIESGTGRLLCLQSAADDGVTSAKFLFSSEDVIYSKIRPELRKVAFPRFIGLASADAYPLRANHLSTAEYLYFLLQSEVFCSSAIARSGRTKMPKINREELFSIDVPVPSLGVQHRIATLLTSVDEVIAANRATLRSVQQLRGALLGQLLSGDHEIPSSYDELLETA